VRIEEIINKSIGVFAPSLSKFWEDHVISNSNLAPSGDIGRDFKVLKTFMGGLAGVIRPGGPTSDFALYGDNTYSLGEKLFTQGLTNTFPDPRAGANPRPYRLGIPLRTSNANIMMTLGELQAEATEALIGEIIAPKLEGFARNIALFLCNSFYTSQNNNYELCTLRSGSTTANSTGVGWCPVTFGDAANGGTAAATTAQALMIDLTYDNYAIDRFQVGMQVAIGSFSTITWTGATIGNPTAITPIWVVAAVDELTGKIYLKPLNASTFQSATATFDGAGNSTLANNMIVIPFGLNGTSTTPFAGTTNPYFTGIAGIRSWMKFGDGNGSTSNANNTLLGAESDSANRINVNSHPEFKSMSVSMANQPLTEHALRKILRRWHMAKGKYGKTIDTLIASDGVWLAYEATRIGREIIDRTNGVSSLANQGSKDTFSFSMDGRTYKGITDSFVEKGVVYGMKGGSNWKRYVPNDQKGVSRFDKADSWIPFRFVANALGMPGNKIPIFNSSGSGNLNMVTEGAQMPGWLRLQLVPDQPDGLLINNVAEDRTYSDV
jgi:hypothetical protein